MTRFTYEWDRDQLEWRVYDDDGMEVAAFPTLEQTEWYVIERSERSER